MRLSLLERAQVKNKWQHPIQTELRGLLLTIQSRYLIEKLHNPAYILNDYREPRLLTVFINGYQLKNSCVSITIANLGFELIIQRKILLWDELSWVKCNAHKIILIWQPFLNGVFGVTDNFFQGSVKLPTTDWKTRLSSIIDLKILDLSPEERP